MPGVATQEDAPISSLASIYQVREALEETYLQVAQTESSLDHLLTKAAANAAEWAETLSTVVNLSTSLSSEADQSTANLLSTSQTTNNACTRIRQLDVVLTNAKSALSWAEDLLTLRVCVEGTNTSLSAYDLHSAARHVATYRPFPQEIFEEPASAAGVAQLDQSIAEISRKVHAVAGTTFSPDTLLSTAEAVDVVRLFAPIGLAEDGLAVLTQYLTGRVARESDTDVRSRIIDIPADERLGSVDEPHLVALARLFESVAPHVYDCEPFMLELFGATSKATLVEALQKQCDTCVDRIITRFKDERGVDDFARPMVRDGLLARPRLVFERTCTRQSTHCEILRVHPCQGRVAGRS